MNLKLILGELDIPEDRKLFLPSGFQQIGDIAILNLMPEVRPYRKEIAEFILERFPRFRTVCEKTGAVKGKLRIPSVEVIAGEGRTKTTHRENGCVYSVDVSKVMFSKGNLRERGRIPALIREGEIVIDMFAGIGYFSIPIARHASPGKIYAIDRNPDSILLLKENIRLNHVEGVIKPLLGDSGNPLLNERADRIIMGYLPRTSRFLPSAFKMLKPTGIIHYHDIFSKRDELWKGPEEILKREAERAGFRLKSITYKNVVKHYAPGVEHVVMDAEFKRTTVYRESRHLVHEI